MDSSKIRIRVNIDSPDVDAYRNYFYKYVLWRKTNTMSELSANQKLDTVLTALYDIYYTAKLSEPIDQDAPVNDGSKSIIGKKRLSREMITAHMGLEGVVQDKPEVGEIDLILEYLYINGYIDKTKEGYGIVYEGMILVENNGFVANAKFAQRENERQTRRDLLLVRGSWIAGIGTMLLALIELVKYFGWVLSIHH